MTKIISRTLSLQSVLLKDYSEYYTFSNFFFHIYFLENQFFNKEYLYLFKTIFNNQKQNNMTCFFFFTKLNIEIN